MTTIVAGAGRVASEGEKFPHRGMITWCIIGATLLQSLDQTIANVALPYMQGSFSASYDEITWVLTSYITAAAIMTAPVGWLASRFGRKPLFIMCIVGFTVASMLCGAAQTLQQIVVFRLLQGMFSAALVPLSQATMLDIYPPEQRGWAMALWGMGVMIGPIMGPTLGGYLTAWYDWRYVFYINLPVGILGTLGLLVFLPNAPGSRSLRFDWLGFALLSLSIGALQMMLDRGQERDWFASREILVEAVLAGLGTYLFLIHLGWARRPLIRPVLFRDINFSAGIVMMFAVGTLLVSSLAMMAPWLQNLAELSGGDRRPGDGAPRLRQPLHDRAERPPVAPYRRAPDGRNRTGHGMLVVLDHDRLDAGRVAARDHSRDHPSGCRLRPGIHPAADAGLRHT